MFISVVKLKPAVRQKLILPAVIYDILYYDHMPHGQETREKHGWNLNLNPAEFRF